MAPCYSSILFRKYKENQSSRLMACQPKDTKRREWGSVPACRRERERPPAVWLLFLYKFFLPLGLPYVNWAIQECCLFYLRSYSGPQTFLCSIFTVFPFLVFYPPPFWTLFSYSVFLTRVLKEDTGNYLHYS